MVEIKSRWITFSIPRPKYLDDMFPGTEECSGMVFEVNYGGKILYVGVGGGKFVGVKDGEHRYTREPDELKITNIGHLVLDILKFLPVTTPNFIYASIHDNIGNDQALRARLEDIFSKAEEFSKIMLLGDFTTALDGRVTPMLGVYAVTDIERLKKNK